MTIFQRSTKPRVKGALPRVFKITGWMKILVSFLILAASGPAVQAISVTLAWNPSTDPLVVGYNIYYGGASGLYTNMDSVGGATSATIVGLMPGVTYYFVATAYSASGVESPLSSEVPYTVPTPARGLAGRIMPGRQVVLTLTGPVGHTYTIQATQDLKTWTVIGIVTIGVLGTLDFIDTNAANYSKRFYRTRG